ncbi:MAG: hypothetical protein JWQ40_2118 [Segetibacter sp.]|nr:hypothetical protein [Segetibacter sp.]
MEPEMVAFLKRVGKSLTVGFIWLAINATAAIKGDNAFIGNHITIANVVFYAWFVISIIVMVIIFKKMWGGKDME